MKKGSLQKVMAIILSVTMITGMLMVDTALAMDGFILGDDSENRLVDDTEATAEPSAPQSSILEPSGADTTEDFTSIIPATKCAFRCFKRFGRNGRRAYDICYFFTDRGQ